MASHSTSAAAGKDFDFPEALIDSPASSACLGRVDLVGNPHKLYP